MTSPTSLARSAEQARTAYQALVAEGLALDLTRGKPAPAQLDLAMPMLSLPGERYRAVDGTDTRNYQGLQGLPELRAIFSEPLQVPVEQLIAFGNSSLELMHDTLVHALLSPLPGAPGRWGDEERIVFLCPVPGYDRHFALCERLGIEMVPVPMTPDGPDMDIVEQLTAADAAVKGIWCVPKHSNPDGTCYSEATVRRLAAVPAAAPDFRIFWDNAYAFHHLTEDEAKSADALSLATASGHPNRPIMYASTSKITFAGAGVAVMAASAANKTWFLKHLSMGSIGPDKVNHLRHVEFFGNADGVRAHMRRHRGIIRPKFTAVDQALTHGLAGLGIAEWTNPTGGYFVNLDVLDGTASRVVALAKEAGIALTPAGASFPLGRDPRNRNIRLAPTFPVLAEVETAMAGVATCVALAAAEQLSAQD